MVEGGPALAAGQVEAVAANARRARQSPPRTPPRSQTPAAVADRLAQLEVASAAELRAIWRAERGAAPPPTLSARLMRLALAWEAQSAIWPVQKADRCWAQIAQHRESGAAAAEAVNGLKPLPVPAGTRLLKAWGGVTHEVLVLANGVQWRGRTYSSLSAVARAITGNPRNGPQFFGLRGGKA